MIAVIVVNFGTSSLIAQYFKGHENLYIFDNFSSQDEVLRISRVAEDFAANLIRSPRNLGFGSAVNEAIKRAIIDGHSKFVVVNPDLLVSPQVVERMAALLSESPNVMLSPKIFDLHGGVWFEGSVILKWRGMARHAEASADGFAPWLSGACLAFSRHQWELLEGFDEDYFLYWEDVDFTYRWTMRGGQLIVDSSLSAIHEVGGSQSSSGKSVLYTSMISRNRLLFARKNLGALSRFRWVVATPLFVLSVVKNANHSTFRGNLRHLFAAACNSFSVRPIKKAV
ncbi:glycosyltransferase [Microbacterium sp. NPDC090007]|uniref:glycosyltransferase n=1 Tax=Microbacterium sp. NPDC090007 TaxID=3364204 RepID=UPI003818B069